MSAEAYGRRSQNRSDGFCETHSELPVCVLHRIPHVLISQSLGRRTLNYVTGVASSCFGVSVSTTMCHHRASVKSLSNRVMPEQVTDLRDETGITKVCVMFETEQQNAIHFTKTASIRYKDN